MDSQISEPLHKSIMSFQDKKDMQNIKILKQGEQVIILLPSEKVLLDLSDMMTQESMRQLGFEVEEFSRIKHSADFKGGNEEVAKVKYHYYKSKYLCKPLFIKQ